MKHTARLIVTVIFLILATSAFITRFWFTAFFWAALAFVVGHKFIRRGRLDLEYENGT